MNPKLITKTPRSLRDKLRLRWGETNDCAVCALAEATGASYGEAHHIFKQRTGRKFGRGAAVYLLLGLGYSEYYWASPRSLRPKSILGHSFKPVKLRHQWPVCSAFPPPEAPSEDSKPSRETLRSFVLRHPQGVFYVLVSEHAFVIRNGVVLDDYDPRPRKRLKHVWEVTKNEKPA